jgi:hypothetical protein
MSLFGYDLRDYARKASKTLLAGFLGVLVGDVLQFFFAGYMPFWLAYWPAVAFGFVVNFNTQVLMKNIPVKKHEKPHDTDTLL